MMGVYIRGMEMPTKCTGCPFVRDIGDYTFVGCKLNVGFAINRAFPYRHNYCPLVPVPDPRPLTNADRLRAMTDEELAEFLTEYRCVHKAPHCMETNCTQCWLDWLKRAESEDER